MKISHFSTLILAGVLVSGSAFAQSGTNSNGGSGSSGTNVDNIGSITVGNLPTPVTITVDKAGVVTATSGGATVTGASLAAALAQAIAKIEASGGSGAVGAAMLLNALREAASKLQ